MNPPDTLLNTASVQFSPSRPANVNVPAKRIPPGQLGFQYNETSDVHPGSERLSQEWQQCIDDTPSSDVNDARAISSDDKALAVVQIMCFKDELETESSNSVNSVDMVDIECKHAKLPIGVQCVKISSAWRPGVVWRAEDVLRLRQLTGVWGYLTGCLAGVPRQSSQLSVPLLLSRSELAVLSALSHCRLTQQPLLQQSPSALPSALLAQLDSFERCSVREQQRWVYAHRRHQLMQRLPAIVAAKLKRREKVSSAGLLTAEQQQQLSTQIQRELMAEVREPEEAHCYRQLYRQCPLRIPSVNTRLKRPSHSTGGSHHSPVDAVYVDLWRRGYVMTDGLKFGCHWLAYIGDPRLVHASLMVLCSWCGHRPSYTQLSATQRLAQSCSKTMLLAQCSRRGRAHHIQYRIYSRHKSHQLQPHVRSLQSTGS